MGRVETKKEYLAELGRKLARLPESERAEILRDHEEHFSDALAAGKSEAQIIEGLGSPESLAQGYLAGRILEQAEKSSSVGFRLVSVGRVLKALVILAPLNFFVLIGPVFFGGGLLGLGWYLSGVLGKVVLSISSSSITGSVTGAPEYLSRLSMVLGGLSGVFAVLAMISIMALLTSGALSLVLRYLRWNLKFFQEGK